jgi:hypothetical protein
LGLFGREKGEKGIRGGGRHATIGAGRR